MWNTIYPQRAKATLKKKSGAGGISSSSSVKDAVGNVIRGARPHAHGGRRGAHQGQEAKGSHEGPGTWAVVGKAA